MKQSFRDILRSSMKSKDTEEWLDVWFTRPIGLVFALLWNKMGIHPNVITIVSIFFGVAAGWFFHYTDTLHNICGILMLMIANFCDSTDGQMARLSGKKTLIGRMLDGFSGDVWFFAIYFAIAIRLWNQPMLATDVTWGIFGLILVVCAGVLCHSPQSSLADYYRQIHLWLLKGKDGAELNTSRQQEEIYKSLPRKGAFWHRVFYYNYTAYCRSQEHRTPLFQKLYAIIENKYGGIENLPADIRQQFITGSKPLMPLTNLLTFNLRAITIYITCLADVPWMYPIIEITILQIMYIYMHRHHEQLCLKIYNTITSNSEFKYEQ